MPVYSYHCQNCGLDFDVQLKMSELDKKIPECVFCKSPTNQRNMCSVPQVGEKVKGTAGDGSQGLKGHG